MQTCQERVRAPRTFRQPRLLIWSINQVDPDEQLSYPALLDYEREARIYALAKLIEAAGATSLWRCVCKAEMYREIRERSPGQRVAMELAIAESMRG